MGKWNEINLKCINRVIIHNWWCPKSSIPTCNILITMLHKNTVYLKTTQKSVTINWPADVYIALRFLMFCKFFHNIHGWIRMLQSRKHLTSNYKHATLNLKNSCLYNAVGLRTQWPDYFNLTIVYIWTWFQFYNFGLFLAIFHILRLDVYV